MPWVRVALNILLVFAVLIAIALAASFLLFPDHTLVPIAVDFLVPISFIVLIWVRKRMIGEPSTDSMSIHAKVCMALIAVMIVLPILGSTPAIDQAEYDKWKLERDIRLTSLPSEQESILYIERMACVGEGGGPDSITQEGLDVCDQIYFDHKYKLQLEKYYANQTANDEVSIP